MNTKSSEKLKENYFINSLARGMKVLSSFTPARPKLSVSEIAEMTGLPQSTIFRLVYTLDRLGYLVREEGTRKYQQSVAMLSIGLAVRENLNITNLARPFVKELSQKTEESAKIAILQGTDIMLVLVVEAPNKLLMPTSVGHRSPVYCTALGKVILAFLPPEQRESIISEIEFKAYTKNTIVDQGALQDELERTREQGYARTNEELILGMSSIAAPIFDNRGQVIAGVNLSGLLTAYLIDGKDIPLIQAVVGTAKQISWALGYREPQEAPPVFEVRG